jgi:hypothetical protein
MKASAAFWEKVRRPFKCIERQGWQNTTSVESLQWSQAQVSYHFDWNDLSTLPNTTRGYSISQGWLGTLAKSQVLSLMDVDPEETVGINADIEGESSCSVDGEDVDEYTSGPGVLHSFTKKALIDVCFILAKFMEVA